MLTERQKRFVDAYRGHGSGLAAARAAGYQGSIETLRVRASKLLRQPEVAEALRDRQASAPAIEPGPDLATDREQQIILTVIARDESAEPKDRIRAIAQLARMQRGAELPTTAGEPSRRPQLVIVRNNRGPEA